MNEYIKSMKWVYTNQVDVGQWKHEMGLNKAIFMWTMKIWDDFKSQCCDLWNGSNETDFFEVYMSHESMKEPIRSQRIVCGSLGIIWIKKWHLTSETSVKNIKESYLIYLW